MQISIIKEINSIEQRVSAVPDNIRLLKSLGADILVEASAGELSGFSDEQYELAGAKISDRSKCLQSDICLCVRMPKKEDLNLLKKGSILIGILNPYENQKFFEDLNNNSITSCCMELIPRISRAQSMDVLSSQANLAGYKAVIDAAEKFGKAFPMMMTAAGRINPAKVMILGVGVAGLQAIATAKRLGAVVSATDVRSATREQVESLGGKFIMVEDDDSKDSETSGGYAKEMSDEYKKKQSILIAETVSKQDILISTALIPGKRAPILITEEMVKSMAKGSIIVDLAVESGGNCPLSKLNEIVDYNGVKIMGYANVPGRVAKDASSLYSKNIINFLSLLIDRESGKLQIDWDDEIIDAVILTHEGKTKLERFL